MRNTFERQRRKDDLRLNVDVGGDTVVDIFAVDVEDQHRDELDVVVLQVLPLAKHSGDKPGALFHADLMTQREELIEEVGGTGVVLPQLAVVVCLATRGRETKRRRSLALKARNDCAKISLHRSLRGLGRSL